MPWRLARSSMPVMSKQKGKTFFAHQPFFEKPQGGPRTISSVTPLSCFRLVLPRPSSHPSREVTRSRSGRFLPAMAGLVRVDTRHRLCHPGRGTQSATYILPQPSTGVLSRVIIPRNMPDVLMEGVCLMGHLAELFLAVGNAERDWDISRENCY